MSSRPDSTRRPAPDELPRSAVSDGPLDLDARTPGPVSGPGRKLVLGVLGLIFLFAVVCAMWLASHYSHDSYLSKPASEVSLAR